MSLCNLRIETSEGAFLARYSRAGLCALSFPGQGDKCNAESTPIPAEVREWHRLATRALARVFQGQPPSELPPLDLTAGSEFQKQVWAGMRKFKWGQTASYGELARSIGRAAATRAVGSACGANPIPVFVPCHRVLAANERLGGFSSGLDWKIKLLALEGVVIDGGRKSNDNTVALALSAR